MSFHFSEQDFREFNRLFGDALLNPDMQRGLLNPSGREQIVRNYRLTYGASEFFVNVEATDFFDLAEKVENALKGKRRLH